MTKFHLAVAQPFIACRADESCPHHLTAYDSPEQALLAVFGPGPQAVQPSFACPVQTATGCEFHLPTGESFTAEQVRRSDLRVGDVAYEPATKTRWLTLVHNGRTVLASPTSSILLELSGYHADLLTYRVLADL